jgi:tryptophanyl-tRNA synthetase
MSKSYGNCLFITEPEEVITEKILKMMTDPARVRRHDPGNPELSPVFAYHKIYSSPQEVAEVVEGCRTAGIGCVDCKRILIKNVVARLRPIRERRLALEQDMGQVKEVLRAETARARAVAVQTMEEVRETVGLDSFR